MSNMTITLGVATAALGLLLAPATSSALTLTNKDKAEHQIGVDYGPKEATHKVAAGKSVTIEGCDDGCGVTGPGTIRGC